MLLIGNSEAKKPIKKQSGLWERGILCPECDNRLDSEFDKYGYRVLTSDLVDKPLIGFEKQPPFAVSLGELNVERFRGFIVSLLWRAHHARHEYYGQVQLGPYEEFAKRVIEDRASLHERQIFGIVPFVVPPKLKDLMLCPYRTRYGDVNVYQLYLPPWGIIAKVDKRPFPTAICHVELMENRQAIALIRTHSSPGERLILGTIKMANSGQSDKVD